MNLENKDEVNVTDTEQNYFRICNSVMVGKFISVTYPFLYIY